MFKNDTENFFGSWGINDSLPDAPGTIKRNRVIILADGTCNVVIILLILILQ